VWRRMVPRSQTEEVQPRPSSAGVQGDCGRVMVVLLTDGRANVSLAKSNRDPDALAEDAPKPTTVRRLLLATAAAPSSQPVA
jgi:hypothetical protein